MEIENWKLKEIIGDFEIIDDNSPEYIADILVKLKLPLVNDYIPNRSQTEIDWTKMPCYYRFLISDKDESLIETLFRKSSIITSKKMILTYGWEEPAIKISTDLFLNDCEGFIRSKLWEGFIFSENFDLIIECTRDYYLHSNFPIYI